VAAGIALPVTWSRTDNRGELADVRVSSIEQSPTEQTPVDVRRILSRGWMTRKPSGSKQMDTTTLLVIVLVVLLLGGGGFFYRRRT
jgi:LPXTG-motif cell wall-anchored protein